MDICLACGAKSYAAGLVSQLPWSGSIAEQKFLRSIPYKAPKNVRTRLMPQTSFILWVTLTFD